MPPSRLTAGDWPIRLIAQDCRRPSCRKFEPMESTSNMKASGARATRSSCSSWASAPSSSSGRSTLCQGLAAKGFRVVRFDNRDIGKSTHLAGQPAQDSRALFAEVMAGRRPHVPYSLDEMADDAVAYCLAKPHSLETYLLLRSNRSRGRPCRCSPHFARHPGEAALRLGAKALAGFEPLGAAFASAGALSAEQRQRPRHSAPISEKSAQICLPTLANPLDERWARRGLFAIRSWT